MYPSPNLRQLPECACGGQGDKVGCREGGEALRWSKMVEGFEPAER